MRLIDADALKKAIIKRLGIKSEKYLLASERSIYNLIDEQQTIEQPKERQPRVLSYKEVMESDFVFIELFTDEKDGVEPEFIRATPLFISYEQPDFVTEYEICGHGTREEYMYTWRCWTARPTEEQRKAEPWKDGEQ